MSALKFTRNKDYSDDANANAGGRDSVDCAGLDGEFDEVLTVTDDHADKLDTVLRADLQVQDDLLQGHEFSATALAVLMGLLNQTSYINYRLNWVTAVAYIPGDLVTEPVSENTYFCLVSHTSGTFATDLASGKWHLFVPAGSSGIPALVVNQVLSNNGASIDWRAITTTEAPTLAPLASPVFTGAVGLPDINVTGRFNSSVETVTFSAAAQAFDFDTEWLKEIDVSADYTAVITAANVTQGDVMEVHLTNTKGSDAALLWDADWVWMGYAPSVLPTGKKAVLALRAPTGATDADVVALWSVEP